MKRPPQTEGEPRVRRRMLLGGTCLLAGSLLCAGLGVHMEYLSDTLLNTVLRDGFAALALGAVYALATPLASAGRRWSFPVAAAVMNRIALASALSLAHTMPTLGMPASTGPGLASTLWGAFFAWASARLLHWPGDSLTRIAGGALAGLGAFALFALARKLSASHAPLTSILAFYWSTWMVFVTLAAAPMPSRGHPR